MEVKQCDEIRRDGAGGGDQKNGGPYCFHYLFYLFNWVLKAQWDRSAQEEFQVEERACKGRKGLNEFQPLVALGSGMGM